MLLSRALLIRGERIAVVLMQNVWKTERHGMYGLVPFHVASSAASAVEACQISIRMLAYPYVLSRSSAEVDRP
jgi:hypothetical protein